MERGQTASNQADLLSPFFYLVDENDSHSHLDFFLSPKGADSSSTMMILLLRAQACAPK